MADDLQKHVLARRQKDLDGYTDKYKQLTDARTAQFAAEVAPIWQRTAQRLEIQVQNLYKEYANAEGVLDAAKMNTIKREIDKLAQMRNQLQKEIKGIEPLVKNKLTKHIGFEFARSHYVSAFNLEKAARVAVQVPLLSYNAVMGVLNNPWLKDGFTYSDRLRANTQYLADKMGQSIGRAMTEGWDVQKAARHIVKTAGEGFYNSVRLARTEITRASSQGASNLYMENADILDGKRWEATLDGRTAARDAENDGKIYPLEYDTPEMEGAAGERIPNHPNCRCGWAPLLSALGVSDKTRIAREGDTPESWGKNTHTKARTYREYAAERGLPSLDERLAGDDLRRYLRPGETTAAFPGKAVGTLPVPAVAAAVGGAPIVTPIVTPFATQVKDRIAQGLNTEADLREVGDIVRQEIDRVLDVTVKELQVGYEKAKADVQDVYNKMHNAAQSGDRDAYDIFRSGYDQALRDRTAAMLKMHEARPKVVAEVIGQVRPVGNPGEMQFAPRSIGAANEALVNVSQYLPSDWLAKSNATAVLTKKVKRGYYRQAYGGNTARVALSPGADGMQRVAFHELGHRFEDLMPEIGRLEAEFYKRRTAGEKLRWLGPGYKQSETARFDQFLSPYMGKYYGGDKYYEIVSMGLESVYVGSYDIAKDPDYYNFILGVLTGI